MVAPQCEAAFAGRETLARGGNAADALVVASLVQGVADPHRCGLGGFACATVAWDRGREVVSIDGHGRAGSRASADQWQSFFESAAPDGFGYVLRGKVNDVGYKSITVPGMLATIAAIHERYGKLRWEDLLIDAADYAEEGFVVTPQLAEFWIRPGLFGRVSTRGRLELTAAGREASLRPDGEPYSAGEVFKQPLLATTYRRLARSGARSFYCGEIADEIAADWQRHDALITAEDLASYRVDSQAPLAGCYRGLEILTTPLPGGGVALLQALKLLEGEDLVRLGHNSVEYIENVSMALRKVWFDRLAHHGDPRFTPADAATLLSSEYLQRLQSGQPPEAGADSKNTTQLTIVDADDNAISFSHSLGYGSGVFTPGCGFMFNNCMSAFDPRPGRSNSIAPGKARSTAIAQTLVRRDGCPFLILGSPGAARITAALVQTILNVRDFGMSVSEAVVQPRFDGYGSDEILLESRFPLRVVAALRRRGWKVHHHEKSFGIVGRVYAIGWDERGALEAAVDPGEPGAAYRAHGPQTGRQAKRTKN